MFTICKNSVKLFILALCFFGKLNNSTLSKYSQNLFNLLSAVFVALGVASINIFLPLTDCNVIMQVLGREPWSSGYGWWLMCGRLWVRFPALYIGWTFFHIDLLSKLYVCLKRPNINQKAAGVCQFLIMQQLSSKPGSKNFDLPFRVKSIQADVR